MAMPGFRRSSFRPPPPRDMGSSGKGASAMGANKDAERAGSPATGGGFRNAFEVDESGLTLLRPRRKPPTQVVRLHLMSGTALYEASRGSGGLSCSVLLLGRCREGIGVTQYWSHRLRCFCCPEVTCGTPVQHTRLLHSFLPLTQCLCKVPPMVSCGWH